MPCSTCKSYFTWPLLLPSHLLLAPPPPTALLTRTTIRLVGHPQVRPDLLTCVDVHKLALLLKPPRGPHPPLLFHVQDSVQACQEVLSLFQVANLGKSPPWCKSRTGGNTILPEKWKRQRKKIVAVFVTQLFCGQCLYLADMLPL